MQKNVNWLVKFPNNEKITRYGRASLNAACYGNDHIGSFLNYFVYEASVEAERQRLEKGCKVVVLTRTLDEIMGRLNYNVSKKTAIRYKTLLNDWGYVASEPYKKEYSVNLEKIQKGIDNPPAAPAKPTYDRHPSKSCRTTTLQPLPDFVSELAEKVVKLQSQVVELQSQVVTLQQKVVDLSTLQPALNGSIQAASHPISETPRLIDCNRLEEKSNTYGETANAVASEPTSIFSGKKSSQKNTGCQRKGNKTPEVVQPELPAPDPLTPEQRVWFENVYCKADAVKVAPKLDERFLSYVPTLFQHAPTVEKLNSLYEHVKKLPFMRGKHVYPGNLVNPTNLNSWYQSQPRQEQPAPAEPAAPDPNELVVWSRVDHPGKPVDHWWLYSEMPLAEAQKYNYKTYISKSDRNVILNKLRLVREGIMQLPPQAAAEMANLQQPA